MKQKNFEIGKKVLTGELDPGLKENSMYFEVEESKAYKNLANFIDKIQKFFLQ